MVKPIEVTENRYGYKSVSVTIEHLIGRTFDKVYQVGDGALVFECQEGKFVFNHHQNCCENVYIEDITGDLNDLVGAPIERAEEAVSGEDPEGYNPSSESYRDSFTWTFYKFATKKGYVDIRWLGESNGYYSESVDLDFEPANG